MGGASDARLNPMSKSNVNPNHYKVAGRERQGEDILQLRNKQRLSESLARERFEPRLPNPPYTGPGGEEFVPAASESPSPESSAKARQVSPTNQTARKRPAAARGKAKAGARHAAKPGAKKSAPPPTARKTPRKPLASAKAGKPTTARRRTSSRSNVGSRPAARATAGAQRKKASTGRRGKR
jgi:hypothetical protein